MRPIKFRAWCVEHAEMIAWEDIERYFGFKELFTLRQDIPLEYTGLKDRYGKEICEGDVVKFEYYDEMVIDDNDIQEYSEDAQITKVQSRGIIKGDFEECQMWLIDWAMDSDYIFEIIGNIYENPELLDSKV